MSTSSLKALIVKELRENLQWAMLACGIAFGMLSIGIYKEFQYGQSIASPLFLYIYEFLCPAAGLIIGLMQMLPEMRRGRWQFVTHRPVSRSALLFVKILVGAALYFLAVGMPVAIISIWVATPGHVPGPFAWTMLDEPLRYFYDGLAWYLAGLLVGCRRGRWFGPRLIPVFAVTAIYFLSYFDFIVKPLVIALLLAAVWGAFMAAGEMAQSRWWARASLAVLLIAGWTVVIAVGTAFVRGAVGPKLWDWGRLDRFPQFQSRQGFAFMDNVWLYTWKNNGYSMLSFSDRLSGDDRGTIDNWQDPEVPAGVSLSDRWANTNIRPDRPVLAPLFAPSQTNWFYVGERRSIEGYDRRTNRYLGSVGLSGFVGPEAPPRPIPDALEGGPWSRSGQMRVEGLLVFPDIVYPDAVYHLHFSPPGIQKIYTAAPGDPVITAELMARYFNVFDELDRPDSYAAVETRNRIHIIRGSQEIMSVPLDRRSGDGSIAVAKLRSGQFVVGYLSKDPIRKTTNTIVRLYNPNGSPAERWSFADNPMSSFESGPEIDWLGICGATGFSPLPMIVQVQSIQHRGEGAPLYIINIVEIALFAAALSVTIAMLILRSRHATRTQVYLWVVVCAAFGVIGILTMAAILNRMPRLRCATCGRRMLPTESTCVRCNAPAAPPKMCGIEILSPGIVMA